MKYFFHFSRILKQELKDDNKKVAKRPTSEQEVAQYLSSGHFLQYGGRRNRLIDKSLEREVLLRKDKSYCHL